MAAALDGPARRRRSTIKIGVLATLEGPFAVLGQDSMRGVELALKEHNCMAGGKKIELIKGSSNATPDTAVNAARKLVEQDKVQIMIGPLSGDEGIAVKNYAKTQPDITFINGSSAAQATTLQRPGAQLLPLHHRRRAVDGGPGRRTRCSKGYKKIVLIAEDYGFPYSQVQGFMVELLPRAARCVDKFWVPLGTKDYSSVIAKIPEDVDAL